MAVAGGARLTGLGARSPHGARVAGLRVTLRGTRPEESPQVGRSDRAPLPPGEGTACRRLPRRPRTGVTAPVPAAGGRRLGSWVEGARVHLLLRSHPAGAVTCVRTAVAGTVGERGVARWHSGC